MPNNAVISCNIDEEGFGKVEYRKLIEKSRKLRKKVSKTVSHEYVMPQSEPCSWLDISLICGGCTIILRVDPRNLYVRGYSTNKHTEFWEFSDSSLIHRSKPVPYSGSLLRDDGSCSAASEVIKVPPGCTPVHVLQFIPLGLIHLRTGIVNLVNEDPYLNPPQSAICLLRIILMITEAVRIPLISEYLIENLWGSRTITLKMRAIHTALSMGTPSSAEVLSDYFSTSSSRTADASNLGSIDYVLVKEIDDPNKIHEIYGTVKVYPVGGRLVNDISTMKINKFLFARHYCSASL